MGKAAKKLEIDGVDVLLGEYVKWLTGSGVYRSLMFPSKANFAQMLGGSVKAPVIDDDTAMRIHASLLALREHDGVTWAVFTDHFIAGVPMITLAKKYGGCRTKVAKIVQGGRYWIFRDLCALRDAA